MTTFRGMVAGAILATGTVYLYVSSQHMFQGATRKGAESGSSVQYPATIVKYPESETNPTADVITIVTAYFNIGSFAKGRESNVRGTSTYMDWMRAYGRLMNPIVAYFDDERIADLFREVRQRSQGRTTIFLINRDDLWSFEQRDAIQKIFKTPGYPHHLPNTVVPEYSCTMHAKFELLQKAAIANYYQTEYISWVDIGLFRFDLETSNFGMVPPPEFDPAKVSYSVVGKFDANQDFKSVIRQNLVWVSGAMNLATVGVMRNFSRDYLAFAQYSIENGIISTDQQVIYGMYTNWIPGKSYRPARIQEYTRGQGDVYLRLAYLCRDAWRAKQLAT